VIPPKEYGAGNVIVWDCGVYSPDEDGQHAFSDRRTAEEQLRAGLEQGKLSILLRGEKLKGSFALVRTSQANQWLLLKHKDRFAQPNDVLARARSVLTDRTVEDSPTIDGLHIDGDPRPSGRRRPCRPSAPMLAEIGGRPRTDRDQPIVDVTRARPCATARCVPVTPRHDLTVPFRRSY
jgi:bifunctional non-homologous end joining protein LigD